MAYQILFVDDSPTMQRVAEIVLAREDMRILAATTGNSALSLAKEQPVQAAVVDVSLPGMDGYAVCQALRSEPGTANIPILLLASSQEPIDQGKFDGCGATAHMNKPFEAQIFIDKVRHMVGLQPSAPVTASKPAASKPLTSPPPPAATPPPSSPIMTAPQAAPSAPAMAAASAPPPAAPAGGGWAMPTAAQDKGQSLAPPPPPPPVRAPTPPPSTEPIPPVRTSMPAPPQPVAAPVKPISPVAVSEAIPGAASAAVAATMQQHMPALEAVSGTLDAKVAAAMFQEIVERISWEVIPALTQAYLEAHHKN